MERADNFIVPPPGLLPEVKPASADGEPVHRGDTTEPFPKFVPRGPGGQPPPATAAPTPPTAPMPESAWVLELQDGTRLALDSPILVGRNPAAMAASPDARLVSLADPAKSLSKTHALLSPLVGGVGVTDLHSTNGVAVTSDAGELAVLEPGVSHLAPEGSAIELGTVRVRVLRVPGV